jgi:hypothetical protein
LEFTEKERYFANFNGTNELDIKIRGEKSRPSTSAAGGQAILPATHSDVTATMKPNKFAPSTRPLAAASDGELDGRQYVVLYILQTLNDLGLTDV